jgi:hypothetical protein
VLVDIPTYVSDGSPVVGPVNQFHGPFDPQISPDGSLVAFEWRQRELHDTGDAGLQSAKRAALLRLHPAHQGVGVTHSDRFTGYEEYGLLDRLDLSVVGRRAGSCCAPIRARYPNVDTVFDPVGPGMGDGPPKPWFWDSKQGIGVDRTSSSRAPSRPSSASPASPTSSCAVYGRCSTPYNAPRAGPDAVGHQHAGGRALTPELSNPAGGRFSSPTLSPDGHGLAFATADGIHTMALPDLSGGCRPAGGEHLLIPGASSPTGARPTYRTRRHGAAAGPQQLGVSVKRSKLRAALRNGLVFTCAAPPARSRPRR